MAAPDLRTALAVPPPVAAVRLLGAVVRRAGVGVRLTEVEAYGGSDDPGSHAFRGRTRRSATMFGAPGLLYCYVAYGMHTCANVVCGADGVAAAVLLRAGEVVEGVDLARERRPRAADRDLARGPALLCRALGLPVADDGSDLTVGPTTVHLAGAVSTNVPTHVSTGPRVGLRLAPDLPWRFWVTGDPSVSTYRRHPRA